MCTSIAFSQYALYGRNLDLECGTSGQSLGRALKDFAHYGRSECRAKNFARRRFWARNVVYSHI